MKTDAPPPGAIIAGKYLVEGTLGTGGMGVVLAARHQQLDQRVAIKLLLPEARRHPEVVERFAREARAAAKIQGEHVARVIDVGVLEDGAPYMVLEYLEGRDLAAELRARGPLPAGEVVQWILEACEAIAQAHAARIVHRDLKPGNLFLARQPDGHAVVKVLDFGISKVVDPTAPALTKTSSLVGTPYYMAPEQLNAAKRVDTRADIWALGVIMYELLAGAPPFDGEQMPEIVGAILGNEPTPLESRRPDLPPGLSQVIAQCMRSKPEHRYQDVAAVAVALAPFARENGDTHTKRIARVLGVSAFETTLIPDTELAPPRATPARSTDGSGPAPTLESAPPPKAPSLAATAASPSVDKQLSVAKSVSGVASSFTGEPPKRSSPLLLVLGVAGLAGAAGLALALRGGPSPEVHGVVSTPMPLAPSTPMPLAPSAAAPSTVAVSEGVTSPPSATVVPKLATVTNGPSSGTASAPRSSVAKSTTPPPASASAASSAKSPASNPKNPWDMGIK